MIVFLVIYEDMEWSLNALKDGIGYFRHCATIFGSVRFFQNFFLRFFGPPLPARIIIPPPDKISTAVYFSTLPDNFSPRWYSVSISWGRERLRSPTGTRTCADGVPDAISSFVIELCKNIVVKF